MKNIFAIIILMCLLQQKLVAQSMTLTDILDSIRESHPSMKFYDAEIQSSDELALVTPTTMLLRAPRSAATLSAPFNCANCR